MDERDQRCCRVQGLCSNITLKEAWLTKGVTSILLNRSKGCICIYLDVFVFVLLSHPMTITSLVVLLLLSNLKFQMITNLINLSVPLSVVQEKVDIVYLCTVHEIKPNHNCCNHQNSISITRCSHLVVPILDCKQKTPLKQFVSTGD